MGSTPSSLRILVTSRAPGEAVQNLELFKRAWAECIELQQQTEEVWLGRALLALQSFQRYEIAVTNGNQVVGAIVLAEDPWDVHVGPCISVFAQYVLPEYRMLGASGMLMRAAVRLAKAGKANTLAFTHRKGPWRYETIYRSIHEEHPEDFPGPNELAGDREVPLPDPRT